MIAALVLIATLAASREAVASSASAAPPAAFDPDAPFTFVSNDGRGDPHIDTLDGAPPTPGERAAVEDAFGFRIVEPPSHMAYATAGSSFFWRGGADDLDVHLRTLSSIPDDAVLVIKSVFEDVQDTIDMNLPDDLWHEIDVNWDTSLPNGVLAGASTWWVTVNQNGTDFRIPVALYELLGGPQPTNNAPAMSITINANAAWDMTLQPTDRGIDAYYLKTVLLHEVTHGLGFTSGVSEVGEANTATPTPWSTRIYGQRDLALPLDTHGSSILRSDNLWLLNADGTWARLFDPSSWQSGSSLSHLNEATYPYSTSVGASPGALMTPFLQRGETSAVDGVVVGVLARLGYTSLIPPHAPAISATHADGNATINISPTAAGASNVPAEAWTISIVNDANAIVAQRTVLATERAVSFSGLHAGTSYTALVAATTDGNTNQTSVQFTTAAAAPTTTVAPTTTPPPAPTTAQPATTAPSNQATSTTETGPPRTPDAPSIIESTTSGCLAAGTAEPFELDTEARASVFRLYCAYFLRLPDTGGFGYWMQQHSTGTDVRRISDFFADSVEFKTRYGTVTDQEYVQLTYVNVLERQPDADGYDYWVARLQDGLSRGDMTLFFSDSSEFRERTHTS